MLFFTSAKTIMDFVGTNRWGRGRPVDIRGDYPRVTHRALDNSAAPRYDSSMKDLEIRERLSRLTGWALNRGRLEKTFLFRDFARAAVFFNKIVNPIEERQHYPVIVVSYNRVSVSTFSNTDGALTEKDFLLAADIEALAPKDAPH